MKIDRLFAIVMLIINRRRVSADELARYFEVSVRTIYRDIDSINMAGIPITAYPGKHGGFEIMDTYKIDRHLLTPDEIFSIVTALKGIGRSVNGTGAVGTAEKLKTLLPEEEKRRLARREETLIIDPSPWMYGGHHREKVESLREAIEENRVIAFTYTGNNAVTLERRAEPMTLMLKGNAWYLFGYCRLREDFRLFRVSRMKDIADTGERFDRRPQGYDPGGWEEFRGDRPMLELTLRFRPAAAARVEDFYRREQIERQEDGSLLVRAAYPEDEWVYGTLLSFGTDVEVLEPKRLRGLMRRRAREIQAIYEKNEPPEKP
ncbi:MAG: YafY family transcriptional regulator [Spirochaetes bacterium]|nr:YafY family transcriptional regulator [Spirochaetota bacterium]